MSTLFHVNDKVVSNDVKFRKSYGNSPMVVIRLEEHHGTVYYICSKENTKDYFRFGENELIKATA